MHTLALIVHSYCTQLFYFWAFLATQGLSHYNFFVLRTRDLVGPFWVDFPNAQPAYKPGPYTWDGAHKACSNLGASLCSFKTLCGGSKPFEGISGTHPGPGDNWTPYKDQDYHWVNTGSSRPCTKEGGSKSSWHGMSHCCEDGADKICCEFPQGRPIHIILTSV